MMPPSQGPPTGSEREPAGAWVDQHADAAVGFFVQVRRDADGLARLMRGLRRAYRDSPVTVVSDGDDRRVWRRLARRYGFTYRAGEYLYGVESGGAVLDRQFELMLATPARWLVKLDADSRVHRRFRKLPVETGLYCTPEWEVQGEALDPPCPQGGCHLFTRDAAERIHASGLMRDDRLRDYAATYADNASARYRAQQWGQVSRDFLTRYACRELGVPIYDFHECHCLATSDLDLTGRDVAVSHPHKTLRMKLKKLRRPGGLKIAARALRRDAGRACLRLAGR